MKAFNKSKRKKLVGSKYITTYGQLEFLNGCEVYRSNSRFVYEGKNTTTVRYNKYKYKF